MHSNESACRKVEVLGWNKSWIFCSNKIFFGSSEIYKFDLGSLGKLKDWYGVFNCLLWSIYRWITWWNFIKIIKRICAGLLKIYHLEYQNITSYMVKSMEYTLVSLKYLQMTFSDVIVYTCKIGSSEVFRDVSIIGLLL